MSEESDLVKRLFAALNRRDVETIEILCDEQIEFFPPVTGVVGGEQPYRGAEGLVRYLEEVSELWEELLLSARRIERRGDTLIVEGRVYARGREYGIRDVPAGWVWQLRDGRFVRGEAHGDPEAVRRLLRPAG